MAIAEIIGGIAALNNALGIAKTLKEVEKSYDEASYKPKIAELIEGLVSGKLALADAREALSDQEAEIKRLLESFRDRSELIVADGGYKYKVDGDGKPQGYPVCPACEQREGRVVQLVQDGAHTKAKCPVCATVYAPVEQHDLAAAQRRAAARARQTETIRAAGRRLA